jgi:hypothetical protein
VVTRVKRDPSRTAIKVGLLGRLQHLGTGKQPTECNTVEEELRLVGTEGDLIAFRRQAT